MLSPVRICPSRARDRTIDLIGLAVIGVDGEVEIVRIVHDADHGLLARGRARIGLALADVVDDDRLGPGDVGEVAVDDGRLARFDPSRPGDRPCAFLRLELWSVLIGHLHVRIPDDGRLHVRLREHGTGPRAQRKNGERGDSKARKNPPVPQVPPSWPLWHPTQSWVEDGFGCTWYPL